MNPTLRLAAVMAHPDDESLGFGGVLARYAAEGVQVSLITATRGQRGRYMGIRPGPGHPGPEGLAKLREAELRAAADVLGVSELVLFDYMDGELDRVEPRPAIALIARHLRRLRPHVVVTFNPEGAYGHPDHVAICQLATAAVVMAADGGAELEEEPHAVSKLYYIADTAELWQVYEYAFKRMVSMVDGVERQAHAWPDWAVTARVDTRAYWPTVWKAVSCHQTQITSYEKLAHLSPVHHEALWGGRTFYRAFSTVNGGRQLETDLFEGLRPGAQAPNLTGSAEER